MKKLSALFLSLVLLFCAATAANAATPPLSVWIDGKQVQFGEQQPYKIEGTTLVPVRMLLEQLDFELGWNEQSRVITASSKKTTLTLQIDHKTAYVNGTPKELAVAPQIVKKVSYVPIRFIIEEVGLTIDWDKATNAVAIDTAVKSKGFMWQVEKNGNTVYLLGSIHVANEAMYPLRDVIEEAFQASDYLAVEIDGTNEEADVGAILDELGVYRDGTTLKNHVSAETYAEVVELLTALELKPDALDKYKPWFASLLLSSLGSESSEYEAELGIDNYFMDKALKRQIPIMELESYRLQYEMFDGFSPELQEGYLLGTIYNFYSEEDGVDNLSEMWVTGDLDTLSKMANDSSGNEEYYNAMLKNRNIAMVDKIDGFLKGTDQKTYFVVVGALHMAGKDGLVTLLEQKGYVVNRL
ncbi:TraB/GumN family protein [Paenibacillus sp. CAU 1782]